MSTDLLAVTWQVSDEPLHSIRAQEQGVLLATGSHNGATTLLEVSSALNTLQRNEKAVITAVSFSNWEFVVNVIATSKRWLL